MKTNSNGNVLFILSSSERDNELKAVFGMYDICTSIEHMPAVGIHKAVEEDYDIIFIEDFFQDMSGMAIANDILTQKDIFIYILASHMADVSIILSLTVYGKGNRCKPSKYGRYSGFFLCHGL